MLRGLSLVGLCIRSSLKLRSRPPVARRAICGLPMHRAPLAWCRAAPILTGSAAGPGQTTGISAPQWHDAPDYKEWLAWMQKYNPSADLIDNLNGYDYVLAHRMVAVPKACGDNLTRENVMKQATSIYDENDPLALPGMVVSSSAAVKRVGPKPMDRVQK